MSYFPFDILITHPVNEFSGLYNQVPFLIQSFTLRFGYSASLFSRPERRKTKILNRFVGFAPGYLTSNEALANSERNREIGINRHQLEPLPGSIDEVNEIGKLMGGVVFTGTEAREGQFKAQASGSQIIHLATHAFLDDKDPLMSTLVFSEERNEEEDGFLRVYELYNMSLKARMVVLSACNTGSGVLKEGEGIMSLARAFYYAGVPSIIMTLWTVDDQQSYNLMVSFYRGLIKGRTAGYSLRKAKLEYLENALPAFQHPRYWAGYILVGNPGNLFIPNFLKQLLFVAATLIILLSAVFARRRYLRKQK